ncbi:hypothetical protein BDV12DRAFT_175657 [Aspergillus spectabilis]
MNFKRQRLVGGHRVRKCQTCRDRKVNCDKQEPFCNACTTRGLLCHGYTGPDTFIYVNLSDHPAPRSSSESNTLTPLRTQANRIRVPALILRQRQTATAPNPVPLTAWTPDPVWNYREFFLSRLVGNAARVPTSGLAALLCDFLNQPSRPGTAGYKCMEALTTGYYLMRTAGPGACVQGIEAYDHAIHAIQAVVNGPCAMACEPDILLSIMSLCLYENIIVTRPRSWVTHYQGISKMIELHGPDHYRSGYNRSLLLAFRYTIIVSAGTLRQRCFLAEPGWRQAIQLSEAEARDPFETILNIAVEVPGLLYGVDRLTSGLLANMEVVVLSATLERTMLELQEWRYTLFRSGGSSSVHNLDVVSALAFYHMVFLLLEDLCYQLQVPWLPAASVLPTPLNGRPSTIRAQHKHLVASQILHLAEQSINADTRIYGVLRFIMALHVAHDHLLLGSLEMHALNNLMNTVMAGEHGFQMARRHDGQYTSFADCLETEEEEELS